MAAQQNSNTPRIIIIGAGPVGIRALEEISRNIPQAQVTLYSDEPCVPYNRVALSNYLAGQQSFDDLKLQPELDSQTNVEIHIDCPINKIDIASQFVMQANGETKAYDHLVMATGSHAHVPALENSDLPGIYTLRSVADADQLKNLNSKNIAVLGGGLLGLETARALFLHNPDCCVTVIDHSPGLMSRQLDKTAGDILANKVRSLGITVILANGVKQINGTSQISSITLRNGDKLDCETLVFAIGIRPNIQLAEDSGIDTRHGIVVDAQMRTSARNIYAVGECAEFEQLTYGIVAPGFEQAKVMADAMVGKKNVYRGSIMTTQLKVLDYPVFSMGRVGEHEAGHSTKRLYFQSPDKTSYRHVVILRGRLIGCIALGE